MSERLQSSYQQLTQIENWTEQVHCGNYTFLKRIKSCFSVISRGTLLFSVPSSLNQMIEVAVVESGLTDLQVPLRVVQTPLTLTGERAKALPGGAAVISQLEDTELGLDYIEDIRMGLTWTQSEEDDRVVHFEPDWYVESQGSWVELTRYIQSQEESLNGF
ncbi:MAG: two-component system activity regulator YycH [Alkalibacterium sp.]|nr:two-component system activity regulator YycH [Alkalibacterium sp.]